MSIYDVDQIDEMGEIWFICNNGGLISISGISISI
jgi:hypothetical protein